ncbi:DNA glycosylase AlkZ-like family protein [Microbacterium flavum]|uniref:Winged helix DNA-binding domain-containing protein n=1 Tax=Microbacterium flavum TaxID=415216 RepID=A0ABS5XXH2_9MICO|nr:crosslink repair DNA glycosylase YcaQ family protein [Microbacterium flavum]MBT8799241.1 winged helix DNA-binding domain-containing protein [Microbacterium flavum]
MSAVALSRGDARRLAVRAQLLDAARPGDIVEVAEQIGAIKIDPTATISPSEQTIPWSRIGWAYEAGQLRKAVEDDRALFEYDGHFHAASRMPALVARMRGRVFRARAAEWMAANEHFRADVLARLRAEGPLPAAGIPDTSQVAHTNESGWYGSNQVPRMLELLSSLGEVGIVRREGRQRVWDLGERVYRGIPEREYDAAGAELEGLRLQAAGIARQKSPWTPVGMAGEAATVEGSAWKWRVDPEALASLEDDPGGRVAILNPYDGFLFDRPRLKELFGFDFVLEQFKPKAQRVYGYFAHPILVGDRFVGLLDAQLDKKKENLVVTAVHELGPLEAVDPLDPEEREMVDAEIRDLAEWLGVPLVVAGER